MQAMATTMSDEAAQHMPALGSEPLIEAPEYLISFLQRQNREQMEAALRSSGLKLASWRILSCIDERGPMSLLELAELSVMERTVASRLVDKLTTEGLLKKNLLPQDKRTSMVSLTSKGQQRLRRSIVKISQLRSHLFAGFSADEYELLRSLLRRLKNNSQTYR